MARRGVQGLASLGVVVSLSAWQGLSEASLVINEIDYDQPGVDTAEFVELFNTGPAPLALGDYLLRFINGATGGAYRTLALPEGTLESQEYFVICTNAERVPGCDWVVTPAQDYLQNGAPDAVALAAGDSLVDTVSYEGNVLGYGEGAGAPADEAGGPGGVSRCPNGQDTGDNAADFRVAVTTPGASNSCGAMPGVGECGEPAVAISAIQGTGGASPLQGQVLAVEGVVTLVAPKLQGFYLQTRPGLEDASADTSEGLFVYAGPGVGAFPEGLVRVVGEVREFDGLTELALPAWRVCAPYSAPSPVSVTFPVLTPSLWESLEGMRVRFSQRLTVTGNADLGRFGSLELSLERLITPTQLVRPGAAALAIAEQQRRSRIILDDASGAQDPEPVPYLDAERGRRVGDTVRDLVGVVDARFGAPRILPESAPVFGADNPRPPAPPARAGRLRVAAFNLLNFFITIDDGVPRCGPSGGLDCRGADSPEELARQRAKLGLALGRLDADILALMELDNSSDGAISAVIDLLNESTGRGSYAMVSTGPLGSDAIRVGLVYDSARVQPSGMPAVLSQSRDARFLDSKNRPVIAQTFVERRTEERLTVAAVHLKSKGSACDDVGDSDTGDGQGNCNVTRTRAAEALADWLLTDPTASGDADVLVLGDFNAYAKEDPLIALATRGLRGLLDPASQPPPYSYQFDGLSGYLDHALASNSLARQVTQVAEWHINADEPDLFDYNLEFRAVDRFSSADPYRASDHDPLLVDLALGQQPATVPLFGSRTSLCCLGASLLWFGAGLVRRRRPRLPR